MPMIFKVLWLVSATVALAAAELPPILPRVAYPGDDIGPGVWLRAPHVLVVTVKRAEITKREVIVDPRLLIMRLVEVEAEVENELAGSVGTATVRFYFFGNAGGRGNPGYKRTFWLEPGKRYVVFLREEAGILRTVFDLEEVSFRVMSGRHGSAELAGPTDVGEKIAQVLLRPGSAYAPEGFAWGVANSAPRLWEITSAKQIVALLRNLQTAPDRQVFERACVVLSEFYRFTDECLTRLAKDPALKLRDDVARLLTVQEQNRAALVEGLRSDPLSLTMTGKTQDFADEMELFTTDVRAEVRLEACAALQRMFPRRPRVQACAATLSAGRID